MGKRNTHKMVPKMTHPHSSMRTTVSPSLCSAVVFKVGVGVWLFLLLLRVGDFVVQSPILIQHTDKFISSHPQEKGCSLVIFGYEVI